MAAEIGQRLLRVYRVNGARETARRATRKLRSIKIGHTFDEVAVIQKLLTSQVDLGLMVDVGAQRGNTLAAFVAAGWEVKAFEPDPVNVAELRARFEASGNLTVFELALSDRVESNVQFFGSPQSTGISGLLKFHESHEVVTHVDVSTLEVALSGEVDRAADFLKIDTEGHDLAVLKGANLSEMAPALILAEFDEQKTAHGGHSLEELQKVLSSAGYEFFVSEWRPINEYGGSHKWKQLCDDCAQLSDSSAWGNIIASKNPVLLGDVRDAIASAAPRQ